MTFLRHVRVIARQDFRILRSDPVFTLVFILMPLVVMAFLKPAFEASLVAAGIVHANGAEQAVPGTAIMFTFLMVGNMGIGIFLEHGWNTWERLRASWLSPAEIMTGKAIVPFIVIATQLAVLFGLGGFLFQLHIAGSIPLLIWIAVCWELCLLGLGFLMVGICRTVNELNAIANVGGLVLAGLGGAIAPFAVLPTWARALGYGTPSYWGMLGFQDVILGRGSASQIWTASAVLLAFAATSFAIGASRFNVDDTKVSFA